MMKETMFPRWEKVKKKFFYRNMFCSNCGKITSIILIKGMAIPNPLLCPKCNFPMVRKTKKKLRKKKVK